MFCLWSPPPSLNHHHESKSRRYHFFRHLRSHLKRRFMLLGVEKISTTIKTVGGKEKIHLVVFSYHSDFLCIFHKKRMQHKCWSKNVEFLEWSYYRCISEVNKSRNQWQVFGWPLIWKGLIHHDLCVTHNSTGEDYDEQNLSLSMLHGQ